MLDLTVHQADGSANVKEIADRQDLPAQYLEQLINRLSAKGFVRTVRGRGGGIVLAKPPSDITLRDIVEEMEGSLNLVERARDPDLCDRALYCVAQDLWEEVSQVITNHLGWITLKDMAQRYHNKLEKGASMYYI